MLLTNGTATYSRYLTPGSHSIRAAYLGWTNYRPSTSATFAEIVESPTKTVVTTSGSPSFIGQPVTFSAFVSAVNTNNGPIPDGETVIFYDGNVVIGSGTMSSGMATFTTSSLSIKTHAIKAVYPGDGTFAPSNHPVQQIVAAYPTTTALSSSLNPSSHGQVVAFIAKATSAGPNPPTGKVTFKDGTTAIGTASMSAGLASFSNANLSVGTHSITAVYNGDSDSAKSTSATLIQVVN